MEANPDGTIKNDESCLPFLVTHWLSAYGNSASSGHDRHPLRQDQSENNDERQKKQADAYERIRRATSELASAFSDLGAFGYTLEHKFGYRNNIDGHIDHRFATYTDITRRWDVLAPNHLQTLLHSSQSATNAAQSERITDLTCTPRSIIGSAYERWNAGAIGGMMGPSSSLALQNEVKQDEGQGEIQIVPIHTSMLHKPLLLTSSLSGCQSKPKERSLHIMVVDEHDKGGDLTQTNTSLTVGSDMHNIDILSSKASKRYLNIKVKYSNELKEIMQLKRSLHYQKNMLNRVDQEISKFLSTCSVSAKANSLEVNNNPNNQKEQSDTLHLMKNESIRVIAQLERRIGEVTTTHESQTRNELRIAKSVSDRLWDASLNMKASYLDPYESYTHFNDYTFNHQVRGNKRNSVLAYLISRSYGINSLLGTRLRTGVVRQQIGKKPSVNALNQRFEAVLTKRMSHFVTVNCHLYCPVYCLRFDRTGQYFVTGADDNLVKVFRLGFPCHKEGREYGSKAMTAIDKRRGAVLICTLRGHASVIADIDINADNTLLATASEDGDVRVWSMADGCPVAILRGHSGGANMVSWSMLTPYRLVSVGQDGLARIWDIREAALKRCTTVRSRNDYEQSNLNKEFVESNTESTDHQEYSQTNHVVEHLEDSIPLPPLPLRDNIENINGSSGVEINGNTNQFDIANNYSGPNGGVFVPPLPAGAENGAGAQAIVNGNNAAAPGSFIANDEIDEGVILLSKLQHGSIAEHQGANTRARRKKINVTCIARCPIGGHFATGSDDGIGRIWADDDDENVANLDKQQRDFNSHFHGESFTNLLPKASKDSLSRTRSSADTTSIEPSTKRLLATLHGHQKPITDIKYSNEGDRLLTASQKDGVVRIWSWGCDTNKHAGGTIKFDQVRQIYLRMVPPPQCQNTSKVANATTGRRRPGASKSTLQVNCDIAAWTSDDSKVVTSQCCLVSATGSDIIPGSQVVHVWDSITGYCIISLPSIHTKPCSVLISHPFDPTVMVSAGADGFARIWNLNTGKCFFSHENIHQYGSVETPSDRGMHCGYLDGNFSPDGLNLVLTDDKGRITVIDAFEEGNDNCEPDKTNINQSLAPLWMQEQYFANDYYELFYDPNGYCIERGSRQPPHLAPGAARCNHIGAAYNITIQDSLRFSPGPSPLCEEEVRMKRDILRQKSFEIRKSGGVLSRNVHGKRPLIESYPTANAYIITDGSATKNNHITLQVQTNVVSAPSENIQRSNNSQRQLSNRYRWLEDDGDMRDNDDVDEGESDYEEGVSALLQPDDDESTRSPSRSRGRRNNDSSSARARRLHNRTEARQESDSDNENTGEDNNIDIQPTRVSARQAARESMNTQRYEDEDSAQSDFEEMLSSNTSPSGQYVQDYTDLGHLFKIPSNVDLSRKWVSRSSCIEGYIGKRLFSPQVGDKVVYIPRAHCDVLHTFPICNNSSTGAPWQSWSTNCNWPVVQCEVKKIRYRFPYNGHFGKKAKNQIKSVVAILTLQLTGIPVHDPHRNFPWPKPEFIPKPPTRSNLNIFDVSIFISGEPDFVIPLDLYLWRVKQLEEAAKSRENLCGLVVNDCYFEPNNDEDPSFDSYECRIVKLIDEDDEDENHFQQSGYNCFVVKYTNNDESSASPWDISVSNPKEPCPLPSCLTNAQKDILLNILDSLKEDTYILNTFCAPVDTRRYVDYLSMVEVPIDISTIRKRLLKDYYTNVQSVRSDMMLIVENCEKYNKSDSDVSIEANNMYRKFLTEFEEKLQDTGTVPGTRAWLGKSVNKGAKDQFHVSEPVETGRQTRSARRTARNHEIQTEPENVSKSAGLSDSNEESDRDIDQSNKFRVTVGNCVIMSEDTNSDEEFEEEENLVGSDNKNETDDYSSSEEEEYESEASESDNEIELKIKSKAKQIPRRTRHSKMRSHIGNNSEEMDFPPQRVTRSRAITGKATYSSSSVLSGDNESYHSSSNDEDEYDREAFKSEDEESDDALKRNRKIKEMHTGTQHSKKEHVASSETSPPTIRTRSRNNSLGSMETFPHRPKRATSVLTTEEARVSLRQSPRISKKRQRHLMEQSTLENLEMANNNTIRTNQKGDQKSTWQTRGKQNASQTYSIASPVSSRHSSHRSIAANTQELESAIPPRRSSRRSINENVYKDDSDSLASDGSNEHKVNEERSPSKKPSTPRKASYPSSTGSKDRSTSRRSTRARKSYHEYSHSDLDQSESEEETLPKQVTKKKSMKTTAKKVTLKSPRRSSRRSINENVSKDNSDSVAFYGSDEHEINEEKSPVKPTRQSSSRKRILGSMLNDVTTSPSQKPSTPKKALHASSANESKARSTPRRSTRVTKNYHEYSHSDLDQSEIEEETIRQVAKKKTVKTAEKKVKSRSHNKDKDVMPDLKRWPSNAVRPDQLSLVCIDILNKMVAYDIEGIFHKPVLEVYPEIAKSYLKKIETPMDFQTIRHERMQHYKVVSDLQNDLILVFKNCCTFNKTNSEYWKYAVNLWRFLDDVFTEVLSERKMDLPRKRARI